MTATDEAGGPLILVQSAPYLGSLARSSVDLALAFAVFSQSPVLLFSGDAVLCLRAEQHAEAVGRKSLRKTIDSLPLYDIERVYVDESSLEQHGLSSDGFPAFAVCVNSAQVRALINEASHVISL
ncbi:DsrE family protein [Congregibacter variabilis]|uniref:DsrE family protein n=1 Tax=Congregibacter variabilis TaxID=3081200 RepID=A0ABZ0I5S8_9GAMM|nr:DsrE family protein [Congregibacter sp. IMCC43200]